MSSDRTATVSVRAGTRDGSRSEGRTEDLWRRLDWRFLMDDPRLGRVAYAGPASEELLAALRKEARSVIGLGESRGAPGAGPEGRRVDLVVLRQPGRRELTAARRVLDEGANGRGRLYCELDRRAALPGLLAGRGSSTDGDAPSTRLLWGDAPGLLRELGFVDVRAHLHYPSFEACREIVPLEPAALTMSLRRHLPRIPGSLGRAGGRFGARALGRLGPCVSLLARSGVGGDGPDAGRGGREEPEGGSPRPAWVGLGDGHPAGVALTPRFRASEHVVLLFPDPAGVGPERAVKVCRRADRSEGLEREAANLRRIQEARPGGFDSVPRLLVTGRVAGAPYLVASGLRGRPMDRSFVRRRTERSVEAVTDWLLGLHRATACRDEPPAERYRRLVGRPLERVSRLLALDREEPGLVEETRRLTRPLARRDWPTVFEHGDLSHPNLLWDAGRGPGVVDWEGADPAGLPAADLFFFLGYVGIARHDAREREGYHRAFEEAFLRPSPGIADAVDRYTAGLGLSPDLLPALLVASWPRRLARLLAGLDPGGADGSGRGEVGTDLGRTGWMREHRFLLFWRRAVRDADVLRLGRGGAP